MQETLKVKDEELENLARDLRARDSTIREIAEKLLETTEAAEAAESAVHIMDEQRRIACAENERLTKEFEKLMESSKLKVMINCFPPTGFVHLFATFFVFQFMIF